MWYLNKSFLLMLFLITLQCEKKSLFDKLSVEEQKSKISVFLSNVRSYDDENFESVKNLHELGVPVNSRNSNGFPATHLAIVFHSVQTVLYLLEHGADVNAIDPDSATILHYAAGAGYPSLVKYLLDHGANVNARADHNLTPSLFAAYSWKTTFPDSLELIWKYLMEAGTDPNAVDDVGNNALLRALFEARAVKESRYLIHNINDEGYRYGGIKALSGIRVEGRSREIRRYSFILYVLKPLIKYGGSPDFKNNAGISARDYAESEYKILLKRYEKFDHLKNGDPLTIYPTYGAIMLFNGNDVQPERIKK